MVAGATLNASAASQSNMSRSGASLDVWHAARRGMRPISDQLECSSSVPSVCAVARCASARRRVWPHTSHVRGGCGGARAVGAFIILAIFD